MTNWDNPEDKFWSLRDIDPDWDGACPCAHGTVLGFQVDVACWRTGQQPGGCAITVGAQDPTNPSWHLRPIDIAAHVHAALRTGWPDADVWIYLPGEQPFLWGVE